MTTAPAQHQAIPPSAVEALRRTVSGVTTYPADPGFGALAGPHDPLPGVVVEASHEADVAAVVGVVRSHGLVLHTAYPPVDGPADGRATDRGATTTASVLLLLRGLGAVAVDPAARTATVGVAATWAALRSATGAHGLPAGEDVVGLRLVGADGFARTVPDGAEVGSDDVLTAVVVALGGSAVADG